MKEKIKQVKKDVIEILEKYPTARNNDKELIIRFLLKRGILINKNHEFVMSYLGVSKLPTFESITRVRRKLQEEGYFQADDEVSEGRRKSELEMRDINKWF